MLTLCDPAWAAEEENPKLALFTLMLNRTPMTLEPGIIHAEADGTRTAEAFTLIGPLRRGRQ